MPFFTADILFAKQLHSPCTLILSPSIKVTWTTSIKRFEHIYQTTNILSFKFCKSNELNWGEKKDKKSLFAHMLYRSKKFPQNNSSCNNELAPTCVHVDSCFSRSYPLRKQYLTSVSFRKELVGGGCGGLRGTRNDDLATVFTSNI